MNDFLDKIYNSPDVGYKSANKFYQYLRLKYPERKIDIKEVNDFLSMKRETQLFKPVNNDDLYNKIISNFVGEQYRSIHLILINTKG